jgi:hypothetical protein
MNAHMRSALEVRGRKDGVGSTLEKVLQLATVAKVERSDGRDNVPSLGGLHDLSDREPQALSNVCVARRVKRIDDQEGWFAARPILKHLRQWVSQTELRDNVRREQTVSGDEYDVTTSALELLGQIKKDRRLAAAWLAYYNETPLLCILSKCPRDAPTEPDLLPFRSDVSEVRQGDLGFARVCLESSDILVIAPPRSRLESCAV